MNCPIFILTVYPSMFKFLIHIYIWYFDNWSFLLFLPRIQMSKIYKRINSIHRIKKYWLEVHKAVLITSINYSFPDLNEIMQTWSQARLQIKEPELFFFSFLQPQYIMIMFNEWNNFRNAQCVKEKRVWWKFKRCARKSKVEIWGSSMPIWICNR